MSTERRVARAGLAVLVGAVAMVGVTATERWAIAALPLGVAAFWAMRGLDEGAPLPAAIFQCYS